MENTIKNKLDLSIMKETLRSMANNIRKYKDDIIKYQKDIIATTDHDDEVMLRTFQYRRSQDRINESKKYRCLHIAYCELRGTPREKIERPIKKLEEEAEKLIVKYKEQYK